MQFAFTLSLLILGSGLMIFRIPVNVRPYREHFGVILLLYGFGNFLAFLGDFLRSLDAETLFVFSKMGMWVLLMIIGFVLAYPLLDKHLFSKAKGFEDQGQIVFDGFEGMRSPLGISGFLLAGMIMLVQIGVI